MALSLTHPSSTTSFKKYEPMTLLIYQTQERVKQLPSNDKHVSAVMLSRHITQSVKTRSYKYCWNVLKCVYALKYFSTFVQMFYITSDFIPSFFCSNWPLWKRNSGWAPCCVALEIWTIQLFCNAKSQEEKWIMQLDSTRFSWVSACLSSARLVFCRSENFILRLTTHETRQTRDMERVRWSAPADAEERLQTATDRDGQVLSEVNRCCSFLRTKVG